MELQEILKGCGLRPKEIATYLAVARLGECSVGQIAKAANIKRTSVYNFIDDLVAQGIVTRTTIHKRHYYRAASPEILLGRQRQSLTNLEQALPLLTSLFQNSQSQIKVSYFSGPNEVQNIEREVLSCRQNAAYIWPGIDVMRIMGGTKIMNDLDRERIRRGVSIRTIRFRKKDIGYTFGAAGTKFLRALRWAPGYFNTSVGMSLYDTGKVGFFGEAGLGFGVLIENVAVYELMLSLYNLLWNDSIPSRDGDGGTEVV